MLFFKLLYNTDNTVYLSLAKPPIPPIYVLDSSGEPPDNLWLVKAVFWLENLPFLAVLWLVKPVKSPSPTEIWKSGSAPRVPLPAWLAELETEGGKRWKNGG